MTLGGDQQKSWAKTIVPVLAVILVAICGFVIGNVRAQTAAETSDNTRWEEIRPDIQKIRAMPDPGQVVTKDQLTEIIKRLDDTTQNIRDDVQYLRQREEKRGH